MTRADRDGSKDADSKRPGGSIGRGSVDRRRSPTFQEWDVSRQRDGGEVRGVGSGGLDGLRHPPSGISSFSITELQSPSDCPTTSPERTPPPPPTQGSTATVLARYWPPPDGQAGRQNTRIDGKIR